MVPKSLFSGTSYQLPKLTSDVGNPNHGVSKISKVVFCSKKQF